MKLKFTFNFKNTGLLLMNPPTPAPEFRSDPPPSACRCTCGALMARLVSEGVEIRCRRCKRTHVIPLEATPGT